MTNPKRTWQSLKRSKMEPTENECLSRILHTSGLLEIQKVSMWRSNSLAKELSYFFLLPSRNQNSEGWDERGNCVSLSDMIIAEDFCPGFDNFIFKIQLLQLSLPSSRHPRCHPALAIKIATQQRLKNLVALCKVLLMFSKQHIY